MKYILDTHILIWWFLDSAKLPPHYKQLITSLEDENEQIGVSIISLWESGMLAKHNRLQLNSSIHQWFEKLSQETLLEIIPLSPDIILESLSLEDSFHKDSADRFITASARVHGLKLLTMDEKIKKSGQVLIA